MLLTKRFTGKSNVSEPLVFFSQKVKTKKNWNDDEMKIHFVNFVSRFFVCEDFGRVASIHCEYYDSSLNPT